MAIDVAVGEPVLRLEGVQRVFGSRGLRVVVPNVWASGLDWSPDGSALAVDVVQLGDADRTEVALVYVAASFLAGTLAVAAGSSLGQRVWPGP